MLCLLLGVLAGPAAAQDRPRDDRGARADRLDAAGDRLMRQGRYFQASDSYSAAVAIDPRDGLRHLAFGHALLAQGHYAYASFRLRRGVRYLGYPKDLNLDFAALFPDARALQRIQRDVRRYLGYYPGEHHALTVQAYLGFYGDDPRGTSWSGWLFRRWQNNRCRIWPRRLPPPRRPWPRLRAIPSSPPGLRRRRRRSSRVLPKSRQRRCRATRLRATPSVVSSRCP
ncbi:MAG: hypothetical protein ACYS22_00285 [Planctomycetota bacterium]